MHEFFQYRRKQTVELRAYDSHEILHNVRIGALDAAGGSPKLGDMIARNPKNHAEKWLVAALDFADNFEPIQELKDKMTGIEELENMVAIQSTDGTWNFSPYMLGMANGLILALATMKGVEPAYLEKPDVWLEDLPPVTGEAVATE